MGKRVFTNKIGTEETGLVMFSYVMGNKAISLEFYFSWMGISGTDHAL